MAVDEQGVYKKKRDKTHESFIVVRPPPSKSNHPLNLQVQLVPPNSRGPAGTRSSTDASDVSLARTTSNRSDVSGYTSVTSLSTVSSSTSTSSGGGRRMIIPLYNLQAHNVMTNVIVDAGTDAKIAKFMKRGLEVIGLAVLEPIELCGGLRYEDSIGQGNYPGFLSADGAHTPTSSHLSLTSDGTHEHSPPLPSTPTPIQERAPTGARKLFGKVFKKKDTPSSPTTPRSPIPPLESIPRAANKRSSLLMNPPMSATSHVFPEAPSSATHNTILGIQPTIRSPSPNQGFTTQKLRPTSYSWPVQRWLKGLPEGLTTPVDHLLEVRVEWTRAPQTKRDGRLSSSRRKRDSNLPSNTPSTSSLARRQPGMSSPTPASPPMIRRSLDRSASPARESLHSVTTSTTDDGSPSRARRSRDDDDDDSDPEDSETPWTCHLVVRRLHPHARHPGVRQSEDAAAATASVDVRVRVAAAVPAPHHPKVVSLLKVPFPLPDLVLTAHWTPQGTQTVEVEARKRVVTPSGVARPATEISPMGTPTQAGIAGGVGKLAASAGNFFSNAKRPGTSSGSSVHGGVGRMHGSHGSHGSPSEQLAFSGVLLSAEELKDLVCCTGLWLVVREGFGGIGRVKRQGDGWRIRG
ncbi:hypothetical protein PHLGIDRAFT_30283 [Phlebiopsis gigantea 11061_1 CR5-6]|uniref:Uncharacterized protein n=1 Tax=Phlebiopsis gigantea (strain 11061_1 CR5-6) TaxID=745531 RepID=A0A0C3SAB1_PHLG1|nr:hypothetical protein PHLGIDRAFT_30283 [Phlebiopsis gigantea 11061_1 CR5-6]